MKPSTYPYHPFETQAGSNPVGGVVCGKVDLNTLLQEEIIVVLELGVVLSILAILLVVILIG